MYLKTLNCAILVLLSVGCKPREPRADLSSNEDFRLPPVIQNMIDKNVTSADELPNLIGSLSRLWAPVYSSESSEQVLVGPSSPRVVSFGFFAEGKEKEGKTNTSVAYLGCPDDYPTEEYPECETVQVGFLDKGFWNLFEVRLAGKNSNRNLIPQVSKPNPAKCLECHGESPQPIWEPYNLWPGVYGSVSRLGFDVLMKSDEKHNFYEYDEYVKWTDKIFASEESRQKYARYTKLAWQKTARTSALLSKEAEEHLLRVKHSSSSDPAAMISFRTAKITAIVAASTVKSHKKYDEFSPAWAYLVNCSGYKGEVTGSSGFTPLVAYGDDEQLDSLQFLVDNLSPKFKSSFLKLVSENKQESQKDLEKQVKEVYTRNPIPYTQSGLEAFGMAARLDGITNKTLAYLLLEKMGLETLRFTSSFRQLFNDTPPDFTSSYGQFIKLLRDNKSIRCDQRLKDAKQVMARLFPNGI